MLKAALTHPKMYDLCARLNCPKREAVGILELLWDFASDYSPQGDIGKHSDGAIARACDWPGDQTAFITALVGSGWIDADPTHRLLIHDWEHHCERWVKAKLAKHRLPFLGTVVATVEPSVVASVVATVEASPSLAFPSLALPSKNTADAVGFARFWMAYPKKVGKGQAERAWHKASPHAAAIFADLEKRKWPEPQFIPNPATYLNGQRWLDEPIPEAAPRRKADPPPHISRPLSAADRARVEATLRAEQERADRMASEAGPVDPAATEARLRSLGVRR